MIDEQLFRQEVRNLKALIQRDPDVLARYDLDGDGEISGEEWDQALDQLRLELERRPVHPGMATRAAFEAVRGDSWMGTSAPSLVSCPEVVVQKQVEHLEAVTGVETCNRYVFIDAATGNEMGGAEEEEGGLKGVLVRQFLGSARPLSLNITDSGPGVWMEGRRPFKILGFIKPPTLTVTWNHGPLGTVRRVWPLLIRRRYDVRLSDGSAPPMRIDGTLFHPWTFPVKKDGRQVASILKKWSGGARELFTDADNFLVRFEDPGLSASERRLLVAAALAIDFDFFEEGGNG